MGHLFTRGVKRGGGCGEGKVQQDEGLGEAHDTCIHTYIQTNIHYVQKTIHRQNNIELVHWGDPS